MEAAQTVTVQLECVCSRTHPGQAVWVLGNVPSFGTWKLNEALRLETSPDSFPTWRLSKNGVRIPREQDVEFKFVIMSENKDYVVWEQIYNRKICTGSPIVYRCTFDDWQSETIPWEPPSKNLKVDLKLSPGADTQTQQPTWMGRSPDTAASPLQRLSSGVDVLSLGSSPAISLSTSSLGGGSSSPYSVASRLLDAGEAGCDDAAEKRAGKSGKVEGGGELPSPSLARVVAGERSARSWREKIEVVKDVITAALKDGRLKNEQETVNLIDSLAYCSIYLRFVSQGDIPCAEDGRHFRPNHHANLSKDLCLLLEQVMLEVNFKDDVMSDAIRLLARSIAPSLPSFGAAFTAAQPLTRIRDIAHRNDIPPELKNEIKHTIQNKLHRCAGPEDLVTTAKLLNRIHGNRGAYPSEFVAEFERFYDELRRFFNATDLETRLRELRHQEDPRAAELIERFLESKARSDDPNAGLTKLLVTLSVCVELRSSFACQLRDSGPVFHHQEVHQIQEMRLAEIFLDDVAFVLLSRSEQLFGQVLDSRWPEAIEALSLGIQNVRISGVKRDECRALASELSALAHQPFHSEDDWLVLKASLERCRRLCEDFTDLQIALFANRSLALGQQLNLPQHAVRVYSEAVIRCSVVFQISKLCRTLLRRLHSLLSLQPYDALVTGEAAGSVLLFDTLEAGVTHCLRLNAGAEAETPRDAASRPNGRPALNGERAGAPLILAARAASGDEEIAGLDGPHARVVALVIGHDLPILSHLGVRARQKGVPFVACQEASAFVPFAAAEGKVLSLTADARTVQFEVLEGTKAAEALSAQKRREERGGDAGKTAEKNAQTPLQLLATSCYPFSSSIPAELLAAAAPPRPLGVHDIRLETCGSKAATCARLRLLVEEAENQNEFSPNSFSPAPAPVFGAASCLAFPYGTVEWILQAQGKTEQFGALIEKLETAAPGPELDDATAKMQDLVMHVALPEDLILPVVECFGARSRLVVRSSANVEDLKGMSAAGLYESVANVSVGDLNAFQSAVATVWASLYSRRATLARRAAGIPQHQACMAVLIQDLVTPELSFILHTVNPLDTREGNRLYAEIAPGLGETLAGASTRGSPYRMTVDKRTGELHMLAFCNYSTSLVPVMPRTRSFTTLRDGQVLQQAAPSVTPSALVKAKVVDYTMEPMTQDLGYRVHVAHRLAAVAATLEAKLDGPQDVEGVIAGDAIWIVQSRPQSFAE